MKNKSTLILMELLVTVLVFAMAAAVCLGIFVRARLMAEETARRDAAVILAQNTAQLLKAGEEPALTDTGELTLSVEPVVTDIPGWKRVRITVFHGQEPVFSLDTGWQEEMP